ncbi:hypothetical protein IW261DRAFT_1425400 [Armillaria novae-zelandiae]|uniref:Uncharacterized protein n=1 Tax=Armillaria novae-zelandiae TaxID=153914 RepID=A0AA39NTD8_9AGAR|nr:hypothetical protein IW261DRAFT_1425400 [Armillaria novae-zelandiae]
MLEKFDSARMRTLLLLVRSELNSQDGLSLVFRQMEQLVPAFNKFMLDNAIFEHGPRCFLTREKGSSLLDDGKLAAPICRSYQERPPPLAIKLYKNASFFKAETGVDPIIGAAGIAPPQDVVYLPVVDQHPQAVLSHCRMVWVHLNTSGVLANSLTDFVLQWGRDYLTNIIAT